MKRLDIACAVFVKIEPERRVALGWHHSCPEAREGCRPTSAYIAEVEHEGCQAISVLENQTAAKTA